MVRSSPVPIKRRAGLGGVNSPARYRRREPERTVLYQVVKDHLRTFLAEARERSEHGFGLPRFVERELERYLLGGLLCHGFARVRCDDCGREVLIPLSCKNRGVCPACTTDACTTRRRTWSSYSVPGAMARFGVGEGVIHRWIRQGLVTATRADDRRQLHLPVSDNYFCRSRCPS